MAPNRQRLTLLIDEPLEFGRDLDGFVVDDARVSRRHLRIEPLTDGRAQITDLGSSNGSMLDGHHVTGPLVAGPGAVVVIGDTRLQLDTNQQTAPDPPVFTPREDSLKTSIEVIADALADDLDQTGGLRPELVGVENEPGTLTLVFTDIEGSTARSVEVGELAWRQVLTAHHQLVEAHVDAHLGRIVKRQGDGYMLCFRSARQGLLAMIGLQRDLERQAREQPRDAVRVRIGLHTGEVLADDDGDLFGQHVVVAARLGGLADGGEILTSDLTHQIAVARGDIPFRRRGPIELKGLAAPQVVFEVDWADATIASPEA